MRRVLVLLMVGLVFFVLAYIVSQKLFTMLA
jgi:hypothetical protein